MNNFIRRQLPTSRFARSVSILAGGGAVGQVFVVLASPILTRLYTPEDFGLLAVYAAMLMIIGVVASLRYQLTIPLPRDEGEAIHLVVLSMLISLCTVSLVALGVFLFDERIANTVNVPGLAKYLWLLPVGVLFVAIYQIFNYWAVRIKAFPTIARTKVVQSLCMLSIQISGYTLGPLALLLGHVAGQAAGISRLSTITVSGHWNALQLVRPSGVLSAARRYRAFPIFYTWDGVFNTLSRQLPPLLFAALFTAAAAGIYMLAHRVLVAPVALIGKAMSDVLLSHGVDARDNGTLQSLVLDLHQKVAKLAMPPALAIAIFSPSVFPAVFGSSWEDAGVMALLLTPGLYMQFVTLPLAIVFTIIEKPNHAMTYSALLLVLRITAISVGAYMGDLIFTIFLFGIASFIGYLVFSTGSAYGVGCKVSEVLNNHARALGISVTIMAIPTFLLLSASAHWALALATAAVLMVGYYIYLFSYKPNRHFPKRST